MWREVLNHPEAENHLVQFTPDPAFLQAGVSRWLAPCLLRGGGALVLTTPEHWRVARMSLRDHGLNPRELEDAGRIRVLDVYEFIAEFMRDGRPRPLVFTARLGTALTLLRQACPEREVRAWGEAVDILVKNRNLFAAQFLEALWNEAIDEHDIRLLCTYALDPLDPETHAAPMCELAARHGTIIPSPDYGRFNAAVECALIEIYGRDAASTILAEFWNRGTGTKMPIGQRILMFFEAKRPGHAARLFARAREHYVPAGIPPARPHAIAA